MNRIAVLALFFAVSGCGHKVQTKLAGAPPHDVFYKHGLQAFREATPEGYARAIAAFRKAADLAPSQCKYSLHLAESLYRLSQEKKYNWEDYSSELSEANRIAEALPTGSCIGADALASRVRALGWAPELAQGRSADARHMSALAVEIDAADPMNWIVFHQLNPSDTRGAILRAVELAPDLPAVQYELGNYRMNRAEYAEAKRAFERVLQLNPRHFRSLIGLIYSTGATDETIDLEPLCRKVVEIAPHFLRAHTLLGDYYAGLEETEKAASAYQASIALNARFYPPLLALGTLMLRAENFDEAERALTALIKLDVKTPQPPHNAVDMSADSQAHYYMGNVWLARGDVMKAKSEYLEALKIMPTYADAMFGLGIALHREGKLDDAIVQYDRVIRSQPDGFPGAFLSRGSIRAERRDFVSALDDLTRAIAIYESNVASLDADAQKAEALGRLRKAEGYRHRRTLVESELQRARESKKAVEAVKGGGR